MEGEVKFEKAEEFGADIDGSRTNKSCGETVPTCGEPAGDDCIWYLGEYIVGTAGEE